MCVTGAIVPECRSGHEEEESSRDCPGTAEWCHRNTLHCTQGKPHFISHCQLIPITANAKYKKFGFRTQYEPVS